MKQLEPLIYALAAIAIAICLTVAIVWEKAPWWRAHPTERRQIDNDKDLIKLHRLHKRHPDVFKEDTP